MAAKASLRHENPPQRDQPASAAAARISTPNFVLVVETMNSATLDLLDCGLWDEI
jgi:hypothetical protein